MTQPSGAVRSRRLDEVFQCLGDALLAVDADGCCVFINAAAARLVRERFGTVHESLVGRSLRGHLAGFAGSALDRAIQRSRAELEVVTFEERDAAYARCLETRVFPSEGGASVIIRDVTEAAAAGERDARERRRIEERVHAERRRRVEAESEAARWAYIFEHVAWGVAIAGADGARLDAVNPAFARMHGYEPHELRGRPIRDLLPPRRHAELPVQLRRTELRGHHTWETELLRKDGSVFPALVDVAAIVGVEGRVAAYAGTVRDLTERKRAEEQMRQAQRTDIVGRLASGVTHDFNNLLMVILGFADLLAAELDADDPRRSDAAEIRKAAQRASGLARQLLTIGQPSIAHRQLLDLNTVVQDLDPLLRPLVPANIRVQLRLAPSLGAIAADRGQMEQVVVNLALNARDAMPAGGELTVETRELSVEAGAGPWPGADLPAGAYVMLSVRDTGEGMDPQTRARLFEPFFSTKASGRNTGLGLSMVYGIVTQAGGHVGVESARGEGTTFHICLPRAAPAQPGLPSVTPPERAGGTECVLIVEDESAVRTLAGRTLAGRGYTVLEAENGREALRVARKYPGSIDLVITDIVMPELGGIELIEGLHAERPEAAVLVISGYLEPATASEAIQMAGLPFLAKPFAPDDLCDAVRTALDRRLRTVVP